MPSSLAAEPRSASLFSGVPLALLAFVVGLCACLGAAGEGGIAPTVQPGGGQLFVLTGNEKGFIRPCGCSKPALGGVHRRGTKLEGLRKAEPGLVVLSLGDLVTQGGQQQRLKFESFLMSMAMMGYAAVAPGKGEFSLGVDYLAGMRTFAGFPMIGLNVLRDGQPFFQPSVRPGDGSVVVTGLVAPFVGVDGVTVTPPAPALRRFFESLDPEKVRALVLFNGAEKDARALARTVPETWRSRTVISFGGSYDGPSELKDTELPVISVGSKGRFLAYVRPGAEQVLSAFRLEEDIPGHPDISAVLEGYRQSLASEKLVEKAPRRKSEIAYVGDAACIECHEDSCKTLDSTPHEHAWSSIKATNDHHDPECVMCHVTGWGDSSGFISEAQTPKFINVTCEACHGPGARHSKIQDRTVNGELGKRFCLKCHDIDNSPQFSFDKYWPKIAHPPEEK